MNQQSTPEDNRRTFRVIIYIVSTIIIAWPLEWILAGILSAFEGGYGDLRRQLLGMCGNAWWGGMNMSNYFLKPKPGSCDGFTTTLFVGAPIIIGYSAFIVLYFKNKYISKKEVLFRKNITNLTIYTCIILIVVLYRFIVGFSPKNPYWAYPDGLILNVNMICLLISYDKVIPIVKNIFKRNFSK